MFVSEWFCCLNDGERGAVRTVAEGLIASLGLGCPAIVLDVYFLLVFRSREARKSAFMEIFRLERKEVPFGDPVEMVEFVVPLDPVMWLAIIAFVVSPSGACIDGCTKWFPD